ncbi:MAG: ROK family protein [Phycisphaerales bacterium]
MPSPKPFVGIDLGGTNMQIGVVDKSGVVLGRARKKTNADQGKDRVIERLVEGVQEACTQAGTTAAQLGGLGIGAPGAVDPNLGVVLEAVNLRWNDVPLAKILKSKLSTPVYVENDVNVAVYGEWKHGSGRGATDILGIWMGTGVGGGLVLNSALYSGAFFTAGEIGHTTLFPGAAMGTRSLEQNCSRTAVADRIIRLIRSNYPSSLAPTVMEEGQIKSKAIAEAFRSGDELTIRVIDEVAVLVGIAAANVVTLLSLPRVILGGGLTEAIGKPLVSLVKKTVREYAFPDRCKQVEVLASELEDDAGLIGAAMLAREQLS